MCWCNWTSTKSLGFKADCLPYESWYFPDGIALIFEGLVLNPIFYKQHNHRLNATQSSDITTTVCLTWTTMSSDVLVWHGNHFADGPWAHHVNLIKCALLLYKTLYSSQVSIVRLPRALSFRNMLILWSDCVTEIQILTKILFAKFGSWAHATFLIWPPFRVRVKATQCEARLMNVLDGVLCVVIQTALLLILRNILYTQSFTYVWCQTCGYFITFLSLHLSKYVEYVTYENARGFCCSLICCFVVFNAFVLWN